jgi:hypothetical protein
MTRRRTLSSSSGRMLVKQTIRIVVSFLLFVTVLETKTRRKYDPPVFSIGQQKIGEKLRYFKSIFPGSACGTPTNPGINPVINRHTLVDPDDSGFLTCCVDAPESLKKFSERQIPAVFGQCPVLVGFWKERLYSLHFAVEDSTIEQLLPEFERLYGPAHLSLRWPDYKLGLVSWSYGDEAIELLRVELDSDSTVGDAQNKETQKTRYVAIDMKTVDFGR